MGLFHSIGLLQALQVLVVLALLHVGGLPQCPALLPVRVPHLVAGVAALTGLLLCAVAALALLRARPVPSRVVPVGLHLRAHLIREQLRCQET